MHIRQRTSSTGPPTSPSSNSGSWQEDDLESQPNMTDKAPLVAQGSEVTPVHGGTVEVTAPADLHEGYVLSVNVNGSVRSVVVPEGGVKEGQIFQATPTDVNGSAHFIPTGNWRDGLCDCLRFGCCHAAFCMGWCFQPILAGQVMTRMSRSWLGGPGERPSVSKTCQIVTGIFIGVGLIQMILGMVIDSGHCLGATVRLDLNSGEQYIECPDGSREPLSSQDTALNASIGSISTVFAIYIFIAICRTRAAMRAKYNIATGTCGGCEDCCCAWFCSCCTVQQMARHTNDYATHEVGCCSSECFNNRGQQVSVPEIEP